jgi:TM2 domain-containing membrane protein YozV
MEMKIYVKSALLSAFFLPGLGQLLKGEKVKGGILIVLVNIFLLVALFLVLQGMGSLLVTAQLSGMVDAERVLEELKGKSPAVRGLMMAFMALWAYGVADALLHKGKEEENRS